MQIPPIGNNPSTNQGSPINPASDAYWSWKTYQPWQNYQPAMNTDPNDTNSVANRMATNIAYFNTINPTNTDSADTKYEVEQCILQGERDTYVMNGMLKPDEAAQLYFYKSCLLLADQFSAAFKNDPSHADVYKKAVEWIGKYKTLISNFESQHPNIKSTSWQISGWQANCPFW